MAARGGASSLVLNSLFCTQMAASGGASINTVQCTQMAARGGASSLIPNSLFCTQMAAGGGASSVAALHGWWHPCTHVLFHR